jgi:hypothetical protein
MTTRRVLRGDPQVSEQPGFYTTAQDTNLT